VKVKACELWDVIRTDRTAQRRAAIAAAVFVVFLTWLSVWLLLVLVYLVGASAVLLRSELLRPAPGDDDDWF